MIPIYEFVGGPRDGGFISMPGDPREWVIEIGLGESSDTTKHYYTPYETPPKVMSGTGRYVYAERRSGRLSEVYFRWLGNDE
jgi:hypothetical protein